MTAVALKRRLRNAPPAPVVQRLVLTDADFLLFSAIARHGPLPSNYLYAFTRSVRRDESYFKFRLTEMYNGDKGGPYLTRPPQQFASFAARYQHLIYDLSPRARQLVSERDDERYAPQRRHDAFLHQAMAGCVGASLELGAAALGIRYISRSEIIESGTCPETTRRSPIPLAIPLPGLPGRSLIPDELFGLRYPSAGYRFFALEIDRATESIERKNPDATSFGKKLDHYVSILNQRAFKAQWGIPNLTILTVTTSAGHLRNLLRFVECHVAPTLWDRFAFQWDPSFGIDWRVPKKPLNLLSGSWRSAAGDKYFGHAPPT